MFIDLSQIAEIEREVQTNNIFIVVPFIAATTIVVMGTDPGDFVGTLRMVC